MQDLHSGPVRNGVGRDAGVVADIKLSYFFNLIEKHDNNQDLNFEPLWN